MTRARVPCAKDCPDRCVEPNCHGYCERYLAYKAAREAELVAINAMKEANRIATDFEVDCKKRNRLYQNEKWLNKQKPGR